MSPARGESYALLRALAAPRAAVRTVLPLAWRRRLAVAAGGAVGTGLRAAVAGVLPIDVVSFPWAILAVNVSGSLLLGYLLSRFLAAGVRSTLTVPLLCTGLLGSYTTFSTLAVEVVLLADAGRAAVATGYAVVSVVVGLAAAWSGIRIAERRR